MAEASKYLRLLQKHSPNYLETHLVSFEVNMRKQKFLLAFQVTIFQAHDCIVALVQVILRTLLSHFSGCQANA